MSSQEKVLVIKRKVLEKLGMFQGVKKENLDYYYQVFLKNGKFIKRDLAEHNSSYKQLIPYSIIFYKDKIFLFQRMGQGTEERLHNKYSIGIGGHINLEDIKDSSNDLIYQGMKREFSEEVEYKGVKSFKLIGLLNDESDSVGLDHLGLIFRVDIASSRIEVKEKDKLTGQLTDVKGLKKYYKGMEKWSKIVCDQLIFDNASK